MLYQTLSQPVILLWLILGGIFCGILWDVKTIFCILFNNKIAKHFFEFFACFCAILLLFTLNLKLNFGELRIYFLLIFVISFILERFISKNFLAKPIAKCYNKMKEKRNARKTKEGEKV